MKRHLSLAPWLILLGASTIFLSGCQAPAAEPDAGNMSLPVITVSTDSARNRATVYSEADRVIVDITSPRGIGNARIRLVEGSWPAEVILRLRLTGLEGLEVGYESDGAWRNLAGVLSHSGGDVWQSVVPPNEPEQPIDDSSPHWMPISHGRADQATSPDSESYFDVQMSPHFLENSSDLFEVSWVDFYR